MSSRALLDHNFVLHLERSKPWLCGLHLEGCQDVNVLSILLVESFFRPVWWRWTEYIALLALRLVNSQRAETVTLGIAQLQFQFWRDSEHASVSFRYERYVDNYLACAAYCDTHGVESNAAAEEIACLYNGEQDPCYITAMMVARNFVERTRSEFLARRFPISHRS